MLFALTGLLNSRTNCPIGSIAMALVSLEKIKQRYNEALGLTIDDGSWTKCSRAMIAQA